MKTTDIIIVGAGPAGSSCASKLQQAGRDVIILEKQAFPRDKLCAGWITPRVLHQLGIEPSQYPYNLTYFDRLHFRFLGIPLTIKTNQYSIRRYEFDSWLLRRSKVPYYTHTVKKIIKDNDYYIIDDTYKCRHLVGAGGTFCPVYSSLFKKENPRARESMIVTLEKEFSFPHKNNKCYLWFFDKMLPGYSWYIPKNDNYINIGIGGKFSTMEARKNNATILDHWKLFMKKLTKYSLLPSTDFSPKGYAYYLRGNVQQVQIDNAYIIGDAAGLATLDMGEGIGPSIESGIAAAQAIIYNKKYTIKHIQKYSLSNILFSKKYSFTR